jgi:di/tricarboxylate transporter
MMIWFVSIIIVVTIYLLITERIPIDLTAIGIIVSLMVTGILEPQEALRGLANPAVITIAAMFMLSRAMMRTGALGFVSERMIAYTRGNSQRVLIMSLIIVAFASAFINNTPIVVLFISILMGVCCEYGLSPSKYLIPISYASILAGTCTLIGTSTNIIVSDLSHASGYGALGMFELTSLGIPIAVVGMVLITLAVPRLMPEHKAPVCEVKDGEERKYLAELKVTAGSRLIGSEPNEIFADKYPGLDVFEVIREPFIHLPDSERIHVLEGDLLFVKASANDLVAILDEKLVELPITEKEMSFKSRSEELIVELIVPPQSRIVGTRLVESSLQYDPDIKIIAVKRRGVHYSEQKLRDLRFRIGDILLAQCPDDHLEQFRVTGEFIIVEDVHHQIVNKRKAPMALTVFIGMIVAASTGLANIMVCAVSAVFLLLLGKCLQLRDAYRAVDVRILLVIVGTLALGLAMQKTGAAQLYAEGFLSLFGGQSPALILSAFILLTSLSTQVLSNNATAVLLIPIGISTALSLGVSPKPFIVAICFGASACYATPIGYQTNLLVYGPGGYRFADYLKLGLPLNLAVLIMASLLIPRIWPF